MIDKYSIQIYILINISSISNYCVNYKSKYNGIYLDKVYINFISRNYIYVHLFTIKLNTILMRYTIFIHEYNFPKSLISGKLKNQ